MANVAEMGGDAFLASLNSLSAVGNGISASLTRSQSQLTAAYSASKKITDAKKRASVQATLQPLIHENSVLRLQFRDLVTKYNGVVNQVRSILQRAGLASPPALSGLGVAPIVIAGVAVVALGAVWAAADYLKAQAAAHAADVAKWSQWAMNTLDNPNATQAALDAAKKLAGAEAKQRAAEKPPGSPGSDPFGLGQLVPILGLVAVILIVPKVLPMLGGGRRATA